MNIPYGDIDRSIARKEQTYQRFSRGLIHRVDHGKDVIAIAPEMSHMRYIKRLDQVARKITTTNDLPVRSVRSPWGESHKLTAIGNDIWLLCKNEALHNEAWLPRRDSPSGNNSLCPAYVFNPYITVMLRVCRRWGPKLAYFSYDSELSANEKPVRDTLEHMVRFVRRVCGSQKFKYIVNNYTRNERENFKSCCHYVAAIFSDHAKLLILRVDLYYLPDQKGWANTHEATKGLEKFRRALREGRIVPDVLGWICRREYGFRRGVHYHLMIIVDGHKHRDAANLSKVIGEYWVDRCTGMERKGSYFNCYVRKDEYEFNGLGLIHLSDRQGLMGIREAIRYITKGDYQLKTEHERNLWRGIMPDVSVKHGAPRKADHDMTLVREILDDA
jgi:hypothetical protein